MSFYKGWYRYRWTLKFTYLPTVSDANKSCSDSESPANRQVAVAGVPVEIVS